ncbi:MAG: hypothetical protein R3Y18_00155 [Bacillota bacterium]
MSKTVNTSINTAVEMTAATSVGTTATYIDFSGRDLVLLASNAGSSAATLTLKAGDGIQGVEDLEIAIAAGKEICILPETGRFKIVNGDNAGKIELIATATVSVQIIEH